MDTQISPRTLAPVLLLIGFVIWLVSRRKLQTLKRMVLVFLISTAVLISLGALLRVSEPEMFAILAIQVALGVADAFGLFHVLSITNTREGKAN